MTAALQTLPLRKLAGFGRSQWSECRVTSVESVDELTELFARCRAERMPLTFRGSGRSYGDPALLADGLVVDLTRLSRVTDWDPATGIVEVEPGVTIEQLWRHTLPDGYWPAVVPGTMRPTLGGCLAMNVHGKNNFRVGSIGEHVLDFDLVTSDGRIIHCSRSENSDVFHAAISGLGLLGAIVRIRLQQKHVDSGLLRVRAFSAPSLDGMFDIFEQRLRTADYLVGWVDCLASGRGLGRGLIHDANHLARDEDPFGPESLQIEQQILPSSVLGVPKSFLPWLMRPFFNNFGVRLINAAKYHASRIFGHDGAPFFQSHVGFAFLFDYIPGWELAYGPGGLVQVQVFAPAAVAKQVFRQVIERSQAQGLPAYLGVMKRHRPDPFLLTHALDGYSLALDYRVTSGNRSRLRALFRVLTDLVLDCGGKFYFAKDSVMTSEDTLRAYGADVLGRFFALKARLDPDGILESELGRRVFGSRTFVDGRRPTSA
jgi:decaprenylphospho-beta-D-ribofuranose 2-oxidase